MEAGWLQRDCPSLVYGIVDADQILVLSQGEIMEQGSHRSLLASKGLYARLWEMQQQEQPEPITVAV